MAMAYEENTDFRQMYKYYGRTFITTQIERRERFLKEQKEKRHETMDEKRNLSDLFKQYTIQEPMDIDRKIKKSTTFAYKFMKCEWMYEPPDDLPENWLVKFCPGGTRYLVVADRNVTTCYYENGNHCFRFKSNLPGGSPKQSGQNKFTILDCIYSKTLKIFFVFDVLAWNAMSLLYSDAQFRFYWLKTKFDENPELSDANRYRFILMDCLPAQLPLIQDFLFQPFMVDDQSLPYEGVLFYHKEGYYKFGKTPLAVWLKTFMINEKLHLDINSIHLNNKPADYENFDEFVNRKVTKRKSGRHVKDKMEQMDAESIECDPVI